MQRPWSPLGWVSGRPHGPAWTPAQLTNLRAWYEADQGTTVATGVSQWDDLSGNARHLLQATGAAQPALTAGAINGKPALTFDGVNDFMQVAYTRGQPTTTFIVFKQISWTNTDYIMDGLTADSAVLFQNAVTPDLRIHAGLTIGPVSSLPVGSFGLVTTIFNGATSVLQVNNFTEVAGNAGAAAAGGLTLGERPAPGSLWSNIAVFMVIDMAAVATASERAAVRAYVARRCGAPQEWVFVGDSTTAGFGGVAAWPIKLQPSAPSMAGFFNLAVPNHTTAQQLAVWQARPAHLATPDRVIVMCGVNDAATDVPAATSFANLTTIYTEARAAGASVVALTAMPFGGSATWTAPRQAILESLNAMVRASANVDIVVDLYATMGQAGTPANFEPTLCLADLVHPNDAGTTLMTSTVAAALGL